MSNSAYFAREATPDDIPALMDIGRKFHSEGSVIGQGLTTFNEGYFRHVTETLINSASGSIHVSVKGNVITGAIYSVVNQPITINETILGELLFFVLPEHRGGRSALALLGAFEKRGSDVGATFLCLSHFEKLGMVGPMYEKKGYSIWEKSYVRRI